MASSIYHHFPSNFEHEISSDVTPPAVNNESLTCELAKNMALELGSKWKNYCCNHRVKKHKNDSYRKGPAPIEEAEDMKKSVTKATCGTLDSDVEDLEFEDMCKNGAVQNDKNPYNKARIKTNAKGDSIASCRALIIYFSKLAKTKDEDETVDLDFVDSLLQNGADINFPDKHGQTVLHEIARGWHPDVAKFALQHGADVNKADGHGRTPLHLAAAVDYDDMLEFLIHNGGNLGARTNGEDQTPMHYAAKNNATASLKIMLRLGAFINERDYKQRTPLFVAAETARADAAQYLIEQGAPAGVYDSSGTACLALMIEKMPQIAIEAVEQFHLLDRAFRKHYYYLSYLEPDPKFLAEAIPSSKRERKEQKERQKEDKRLMKQQGNEKAKKHKTYAKTPLEIIVQYNQLDLIMHPVFQRLLLVKWNLFAKWGSWALVLLNLFYTLIWTFLGIFIPRGEKLQYYDPLSSNWWRLVLELIGLMLTGYFMFMEITQFRRIGKNQMKWRVWQIKHMNKDLNYCHPRWPEEKKYLDSELAQIRTYQQTYFREPWNIFEWISYFVVLTLAVTRVLSVVSKYKAAEEIHPKIYAIGLIVLWLRFMRSCRVFQSLGPFIEILGSVIADTMKFAFLFFEFYIPYVVGFWIVFGGPYHASKIPDDDEHIDPKNWEKFNDLMFSVWSMTLMGDFDFNYLVEIDRLMAQILCGSYFALAGVVCINLYIALLSDTFARVYAQAQANAVMQLAQSVILLESKLGKEKRLKFAHYLQDECSPEEVYCRDEGNLPDNHGNDLFEKVVRQVTNRIDELEDNIKRSSSSSKGSDGISGRYNTPSRPLSGPRHPSGGSGGSDGASTNQLVPIFQQQNSQLSNIKKDLDEIKGLMHKLLKTPLQQQLGASSLPPSQQESPEQQPLEQYSLQPPYSTRLVESQYLLQSAQAQHPSSLLHPSVPRGSISDMDHTSSFGRGRGRGRKNKQGKFSSFGSDDHSVASEVVPMQSIRTTCSRSQSFQSAPGDKTKRHRTQQPFTGSWDGIRSDLHV